MIECWEVEREYFVKSYEVVTTEEENCDNDDVLLLLTSKMQTASNLIEDDERAENELIFSQIKSLYRSLEDDKNQPRLDTVIQKLHERLDEQIQRKDKADKFKQETALRVLEKALDI